MSSPLSSPSSLFSEPDEHEPTSPPPGWRQSEAQDDNLAFLHGHAFASFRTPPIPGLFIFPSLVPADQACQCIHLLILLRP